MSKIDNIDPKMIANNITPFEPTHPGEILKDEIEYRGISQKKLAKEMGVSYTVLNEILNAKRPLNTEYAMLIGAALMLNLYLKCKHATICKWQKTIASLWKN